MNYTAYNAGYDDGRWDEPQQPDPDMSPEDVEEYLAGWDEGQRDFYAYQDEDNFED